MSALAGPIRGKGSKIRTVPLHRDLAGALEARREQGDELPELAQDPLLFARLGPAPDAGGQLSTMAVAPPDPRGPTKHRDIRALTEVRQP